MRESAIKGEEEEIIAKQGSAIFISSNEEHQFKNIGNEPLEFYAQKKLLNNILMVHIDKKGENCGKVLACPMLNERVHA